MRTLRIAFLRMQLNKIIYDGLNYLASGDRLSENAKSKKFSINTYDSKIYQNTYFRIACKELTQVFSVILLQLLAYHRVVLRGGDVDKPKNLAKSVTVE